MNHQREEEMLRLVEEAIHLLKLRGERVTQRRVCTIIGKTYHGVTAYPRVKARFVQIAHGRQSEDELVRQVELAIAHLQVRGEPITQHRIIKLVPCSLSTLRHYPRAKALLEKYHESGRSNGKYEKELVKRVQQTIAGLKAHGDPLTPRSVRQALGWSKERLERHPQVQVLLKQYTEAEQVDSQSLEQHEEELLAQIEQAIKHLEATSEPILPRTIGKMIHFPFQRLDDYPRIKARFQQLLDESH